MKVLLCTIAFRDRLLDYALDVAIETGFDGVEIWGREPHMAERFDENRLRAAKKLLDQTKAVPYVFGSYVRFGATKLEGHPSVGDALHTARWLKTPLLRVWASDVSSAEATEAVWQRTVAEARDACDAAAKLGLVLAVEMHQGSLADTAASALKLMHLVERSNFRLNFQIAARDDGQTPEERLTAVLPWVAHVHAQNYARLPEALDDPVRRAPLAAGVADYARLVGILKEGGYQGCIGVEFAYDEGRNKRKALAEDLQFIRSVCG